MKYKLLCVLVLACVFVQAIQAQTVLQPSNPNDVCAAAWQQYEKGDKLWKTGWGLFVPGVVMATVGGVYGFTRMFGYDGSMTTNYPFIAGMTVLSAGCAMTISSIPCLVIGQKNRQAAKKTIDDQHCAAEPPLTFSIQSSANGLGLAMQF